MEFNKKWQESGSQRPDHDIPMFITVYFQQYIFLPKNQEKMWSEEIINKIDLELIHEHIFLSLSFWSLV